MKFLGKSPTTYLFFFTLALDAWIDTAWIDAAWIDAAWIDAAWIDAAWIDAAWIDAAWVDAAWIDAAWIDAAWIDAAWIDAAWIDTAWIDAAWIDAAWIDAAWIDAAWIDAVIIFDRLSGSGKWIWQIWAKFVLMLRLSRHTLIAYFQRNINNLIIWPGSSVVIQCGNFTRPLDCWITGFLEFLDRTK